MTPLSPEIQAELAKLHDIRVLAPVGWWPLAPGWWAVIALLCVALIAGAVIELRRRRSLRFAALQELGALKSQLGRAPAADIARDLAVLLRRILLADPTARRLTTLTGPEWEATLAGGGFSAPVAQFLSNAPYVRAVADDGQSLLARAITEVETWIRRRK